MNDILINKTEIIRLKAPDSVSSVSFPPSFSDDLIVLCHIILTTLDTLSASQCINLPPSVHLIHANVLTSIVSIFQKSGFIKFLPNTTLDQIRSTCYDAVVSIPERDFREHFINRVYLIKLLPTFVKTSHLMTVINNSPFRPYPNGLPAKELDRAVSSVLNSPSLQNGLEALSRFEEWRGVMEKCVGKTELLNDVSFLRMPCFKPALLNLQSKFQMIAQHHLLSNQPSPNPTMILSLDPTTDWSTTAPSLAIQSSFTFNTAHLSNPTTNMTSLKNDSERSDMTLSTNPLSNSSVQQLTSQQEILQILSVLHSLITNPLIPTSPRSLPLPPFHLQPEPDFSLIFNQPIDYKETFSPLTFDEEDEATLTHTILRCHRLCMVVPPHQCIMRMDQFVEGLAALLENSNRNLQSAVYSLLVSLFYKLDFGEIHQNLLFSLRFAFREGSIASQKVLIHVAMIVSVHMTTSSKTVADPLLNFDWDGLVKIHNMDLDYFTQCLLLLCINFHRLRKISPQLAESIFLNFETHQQVIFEIASFFSFLLETNRRPFFQPYLEFSLIMAFFFGQTLPDPIIQSLWKKTDFDFSSPTLGFHPSFLLNHTSSNCNRHMQPVLLMELLFERLIRTSPHIIFLKPILSPEENESSQFLLTPLNGLHPLLLRGLLPRNMKIHLQNFVYVMIYIISSSSFSWMELDELLFWFHPTPLVVDFFGPPIIIVHASGLLKSVLRLFLNCLLPSCAPAPTPALVSVSLEVLARLVRVSSDALRMELVWYGMLNDVIEADKSRIYNSLVALVKAEYPFDAALQDRAARRIPLWF
ncbi:hypothetical protein BLNAU_15859 [Blattamonas nauphoetae]|uniref:Uncharacterized protein n=1 Tax=Blattamonas nauphoetae TaxID=2049346 RepID=A0ABQ9XG59_9EUKA|nr:hypothetical protein BLNAU_15859 [Blattamonas nauphoetae]